MGNCAIRATTKTEPVPVCRAPYKVLSASLLCETVAFVQKQKINLKSETKSVIFSQGVSAMLCTDLIMLKEERKEFTLTVEIDDSIRRNAEICEVLLPTIPPDLLHFIFEYGQGDRTSFLIQSWFDCDMLSWLHKRAFQVLYEKAERSDPWCAVQYWFTDLEYCSHKHCTKARLSQVVLLSTDSPVWPQ